MHIIFDDEVAEAIIKAWEDMPDWVHKKGHLTVIDGNPILNISVRTCKRWDEDGCHVTIKRLKSAKVVDGEMALDWEDVTIPMWRPVQKYHPFWGPRGIQDEFSEMYEIPSELVDEEDDKTRQYQYSQWHSIRQDKSQYVPGALSGMQILNDEPLPCIRKEGADVWVTCRYHTSINKAKQILSMDVSAETKARLLLPLCIRPKRWENELPNGPWTYNDWDNMLAIVTHKMVRAASSGKSPEKARRRAWAQIYKEHPYLHDYRKWIPSADGKKGVRLNNDKLAILRRDAKIMLDVGGFDVELKYALDAYRHYVSRDEYGFKVKEQAICPFCVDHPEGKYPARITKWTATTKMLKLCTDDKAWVDFADMSGVAFNKLPEQERKEMCGCTCKSCWQEKAFFQEGDKFIVTIDSILYEDVFEGALDTLIHGKEWGVDLIPEKEMELLLDNLRRIGYDTTEMPDMKGDYDPSDPNQLEKDEKDAWNNVNHQSLADEIHADFEVYKKSGEVVIKPYNKAEHDKAYKKYIMARVRENRRANARWAKWLEDWRKIPYPEPTMSPKLNSPEEREKAREKLDHELRKFRFDHKSALTLEEEAREQADYEFSEKWRARVYASRREIKRGEHKITGTVTVKSNKKNWVFYTPQDLDRMFPSMKRVY